MNFEELSKFITENGQELINTMVQFVHEYEADDTVELLMRFYIPLPARDAVLPKKLLKTDDGRFLVCIKTGTSRRAYDVFNDDITEDAVTGIYIDESGEESKRAFPEEPKTPEDILLEMLCESRSDMRVMALLAEHKIPVELRYAAQYGHIFAADSGEMFSGARKEDGQVIDLKTGKGVSGALFVTGKYVSTE